MISVKHPDPVAEQGGENAGFGHKQTGIEKRVNGRWTLTGLAPAHRPVRFDFVLISGFFGAVSNIS